MLNTGQLQNCQNTAFIPNWYFTEMHLWWRKSCNLLWNRLASSQTATFCKELIFELLKRSTIEVRGKWQAHLNSRGVHQQSSLLKWRRKARLILDKISMLTWLVKRLMGSQPYHLFAFQHSWLVSRLYLHQDKDETVTEKPQQHTMTVSFCFKELFGAQQNMNPPFKMSCFPPSGRWTWCPVH